MKEPHRYSLLSFLLALPLIIGMGLSACSKVATPVVGEYRAAVNLKGGELPLDIAVTTAKDPARGAAIVSLRQGDQSVEAAQVDIKDGHMTATWTDIGTMDVRFDRSSMNGELRMTNAEGKQVTLPLSAQLNQPWRFIQQSGTDNADASGAWQLEAISTEHFNVPVAMQLQQHHDQVDGVLTLPDGRTVSVIGQVKGDDVYLGTLGYGRATLFKGKVNARGELQGEFWVNGSTAHPWVARRVQEQTSVEDASLRRVGLPWAVPTRN